VEPAAAKKEVQRVQAAANKEVRRVQVAMWQGIGLQRMIATVLNKTMPLVLFFF
jgi:hypothetical protein